MRWRINMSTIIPNAAPLANTSFASPRDAKKPSGNSFEALLHPGAGTVPGASMGRVSSVETLANGNEQKAFATHVLSYVDVVKVELAADRKMETMITTKTYGLTSSHSPGLSAQGQAVENRAGALLTQSVAQGALHSKSENQSSLLAPTLLKVWYEKLKISIFGSDEKTLVVRDYFTNNDYSLEDFQKNLAQGESINKLILNGKEK